MTDEANERDELTGALGSMVAGVLGEISDRAADEYRRAKDEPTVVKAAQALERMDCIRFADAARDRLKPLEGLLSLKLGGSDLAEFLFMNAAFVEMHLERVIREAEGNYAYVDKARHILRRAAKAAAAGTEIKLVDDDADAYWLTKKVFRTHGEIMSFLLALESLFYGSPDPFIEQSLKIRLAHGHRESAVNLLVKLVTTHRG